MDHSEITNFIIREYSKRRHMDDIIIKVCEKTGMQWDDAEQIVQKVYFDHQGEISSRKQILVTSIAVSTIVIGIILSLSILVATLSGWVIYFLKFPLPYLGNLLLFGLGIVITAGGIKGFLK